jgi:hypothetical protein
VPTALVQQAADRLEHHGDRRLVVRAQDRPRRVANDTVRHDRLDRPLRRHSVEVRAQENRRSLGRGLDPGEDVPHGRPDPRPGVVLARLETELAQVLEHPVGDRPLLSGRARDRGQLREERDDVWQRGDGHAPI